MGLQRPFRPLSWSDHLASISFPCSLHSWPTAPLVSSSTSGMLLSPCLGLTVLCVAFCPQRSACWQNQSLLSQALFQALFVKMTNVPPPPPAHSCTSCSVLFIFFLNTYISNFYYVDHLFPLEYKPHEGKNLLILLLGFLVPRVGPGVYRYPVNTRTEVSQSTWSSDVQKHQNWL